MTRRYGWRPDLPDCRDHLYRATAPVPMPAQVSLRPLVTSVYDQGQLGSCTANAIGQAVMICERVQKFATVQPLSRLFVYYNERQGEGTVNQDAGAQIRDGIKSVATQGCCLETTWPYDIAQFASRPSDAAYNEALKHLAQQYQRVPQSLFALQQCLAQGYPFVLGISVYESFESAAVAQSGNAPIPDRSEELLGGHAVCAVGYNSGPAIALANGQLWPSETFLLQNSWGTDWGLRGDFAGCFTLPFEYLIDSNLADDFWTIRMVEL